MSVPGVRQVEVEYDNQLAIAQYDASVPEEKAMEAMVAALKGEGYDAWSTATERKTPSSSL